MRFRLATLVAATCAVGLVSAPERAEAQLRTGFNSTLVARGDDNFSSAFDFGFTAFLRGGNHTFGQLCMNGYLILSGSVGTDNFGCNFGSITLGATAGSGITEYGTVIVGLGQDLLSTNAASGQLAYGAGSVNGRNAIGATWQGVWNWSSGNTAATPNFFQIVLIDRGDTGVGNFDIEYNYGALTSTSTSAGVFDDGGFSGSAFVQSVAVAANSSRLQCFRGGNLASCATTPPPGQVVPEPSTYALVATGLAGLLLAARRRARRAA